MNAPIPLLGKLAAGAAAYAYLNGKYDINSDLFAIRQLFAVKFYTFLQSRRDTVNTFYTLEYWTQQQPDKPFLIYNGTTWTYKQTYDQVLRYGTWLKNRFSLKPKDIVAIDFMNSEVFIFLWFGLWSIGCKPAFINYNLVGNPLIHCLKTAGTRIILVDEEVYASFPPETLSALSSVSLTSEAAPLEIVNFTSDIFAEIDATLPVRASNKDRGGQTSTDMSILIYTSGTTGLPKAAITPWRKTTNISRVFAEMAGVTRDDIFYTSMPLYHGSAAIVGSAAILAVGGTLSLGRKFARGKFWEEVRSSGATVIQYVGETCRYLLSAPPSPLDKQHRVRTAYGNGLRPDVWAQFKERFGIQTIAEFYAATEGPMALWNTSSNSFTEGAIGKSGRLRKLIQGKACVIAKYDVDSELLIRDANGFCIVVPDGQPGELLFKLPDDTNDAFQGYWGNKGATNKKILRDVITKGDAYFSSGDILRCDSEGRWYFVDRIGDTFRWKSENVSTTEVAEVLATQRDLVDEVNVYGVALPGHEGRAGCAAVLLSEREQADFNGSGRVSTTVLAGLAQAARKNLPRYAIPVFLRVLRDEAATSSQRTGTNKQQKGVLRDQGVEPSKTTGSGDKFFWLPVGGSEYVEFGEEEWNALVAGKAKL